VAEHVLAEGLLTHVERRGGEIDDGLRAGFGEDFDGVLVIAAALPEVTIVPDIFADADPQAAALQVEDLRTVGGLEVAVFVEDIVGGQEGLVIGMADRAILHENGTVEERPSHVGGIEGGDADQHGRASGEFGGDALELLRATLDEATAHQKIARQVSHEGQFGRDHEVGAECLRLFNAAHDERGITANIAGGRISLKQRNTQTEPPSNQCIYPRYARDEMDIKALLDTPPWEWPGDAGTTIRKVLLDAKSKESERLGAVELAGSLVVMNDEMAAALLTVLRDAKEPERLRGLAAISMGPVLEQTDLDGFEDLLMGEEPPVSEPVFRTIRKALHEVYLDTSNPKEVRRRALEGSVRAADDWHPAAIREAYASGDPEWVLTAVFAMRYVRGFNAQILESLNSKDPEIHMEAVAAAGSSEIAAAWPHVSALVKNPNTPKPLLLAAISAVAQIRAEEAKPMLVELLDSEDEEISDAADEALSMTGAYSEYDEDEEDEDDDEVN
jgi:hypothetical protein